MEIVEVEIFSTLVCLSIFEDVQNSIEIREDLVRASKSGNKSDQDRLDWAFIDADMIASIEHVLTAIYQVLVADSNEDLKTKTLHSEILWALSPGTNIMDAIKRFGIGPKTKRVLMIKLIKLGEEALERSDPQALKVSLERNSRELIRGNPVDLRKSLGGDGVDWKELRKIYKLNEEPIIKSIDREIQKSKDDLELRIRLIESLESNLNRIIVSSVSLKSVAS